MNKLQASVLFWLGMTFTVVLTATFFIFGYMLMFGTLDPVRICATALFAQQAMEDEAGGKIGVGLTCVQTVVLLYKWPLIILMASPALGYLVNWAAIRRIGVKVEALGSSLNLTPGAAADEVADAAAEKADEIKGPGMPEPKGKGELPQRL